MQYDAKLYNFFYIYRFFLQKKIFFLKIALYRGDFVVE
jgi:hypothetical protein